MKIIGAFNIDLSDLPAASETRDFTVSGSAGATFSLEVKNDSGRYYNFTTKTFQVAKTRLDNIVIKNRQYRDSITFPTVTSDDQYDFYLFAEQGAIHPRYEEVRFGDGTIDINSTVGSNSLLVRKVIYQYTDLTLSIRTYSPTGAFTIGSLVNDDFVVSSGRGLSKTPFIISCSSASTASFRISKQPTPDDVLSFVQPTVAAAPEKLPGENIYPAVSNTDTVDGAVTSGVKVVMDTNVADKMKVGDRITGNTALNAATVTVVALNPDGDNVKEFSMSEAIALADGLTLSFSNRMNYQWPVDNIKNIKEDMILVNTSGIVSNTSIGKYEDTVTLFPNSADERIIVKNEASALNTKAQKPTVVKGLVTVQPGNIVLDKQQTNDFAGITLKVGGYGTDHILDIYGYEIKFTDLAVALTPVTTTTTAASFDSTSVVVAARDGILNSVSTVSGIGIDPTATAPTVNSGASATGAGTIVLSAAQTLENGVTLTFDGAGKIATITGFVEVIKAGNSDAIIYFDVEKLLTSA